MPSPNAIAPPPSPAHFQLSTFDSRLFCSKPFRITYICKNASASPLDSALTSKRAAKSFTSNTYEKHTGGGGVPHYPWVVGIQFPVRTANRGTGDSGYFRLSTVDCHLAVTSYFF